MPARDERFGYLSSQWFSKKRRRKALPQHNAPSGISTANPIELATDGLSMSDGNAMTGTPIIDARGKRTAALDQRTTDIPQGQTENAMKITNKDRRAFCTEMVIVLGLMKRAVGEENTHPMMSRPGLIYRMHRRGASTATAPYSKHVEQVVLWRPCRKL